MDKNEIARHANELDAQEDIRKIERRVRKDERRVEGTGSRPWKARRQTTDIDTLYARAGGMGLRVEEDCLPRG